MTAVLNDFRSHCMAALFLGDVPAFALADGTIRRPGAGDDCVRAHAALLSAARAPNGGAMLTSGEDGRVCRTAGEGRSQEIAVLPRKWVTCVAAEAAGRLAYACGRKVWLHSPCGTVRELQHQRNVKAIAFSAEGARLGVAQQDGITIHSTGDEGRQPQEIAWNDIHLALTFSPDGRFLVVASQGSFLHGWRLADGKHFRMLGYPGKVADWAWNANGNLLATSGAGAAIVWPFDGESGPMGRNAVELGGGDAGTVTAVAWHPDEDLLAIGHADGSIQAVAIVGTREGRPLRTAGRASVTSLAWHAQGRSIAFGSTAGECGVLQVRP